MTASPTVADVRSSRAAIGMAVLGVGTAVVAASLRVVSGFEFSVSAVAFNVVAIPLGGLVGAVIAVRRPGNRIAWVLLVLAVLHGTSLFTAEYATLGLRRADPLPFAAAAAWMRSPLLTFTGAAFVLFLVWFPSGRPHSRRWAGFAWVAVPLLAMGGVLATLEPGRSPWGADGRPLPVVNPLTGELFATLALVGRTITEELGVAFILVAAAAALAARYRASGGEVRRQIAWVAYAGVLFTVTFAAAEVLGHGRVGGALHAASQLVAVFVPLAIGVAVLRYRLYEIDRIVSRTVSYGIVVAVLGAVYVGVVVGLGAALSSLTGHQGSDLAVAVSVLVVVALFGPVRSRVQRAVDRRFNRSGYGARRVVDGFAAELRDEVDPEELSRGVATTASAVVQPATASLWLAGQEVAQ